jgi:hypothetical protein
MRVRQTYVLPVGPDFACPSCSRGPMLAGSSLEDLTTGYMLGFRWQCSLCGSETDLRELVTHVLGQSNDLAHAACLATGRVTMLVVEYDRGQQFVLDLVEYGVPPGARIHRVVMTAQDRPVGFSTIGGVIGRRPGTTLVLLPYEWDDPEAGPWETAEVAIHVTWSEHSDDTPLDLLTTAYAAFADGDVKRAILDAHTAVDIALQDAVYPALRAEGLSGGQRLAVEQRLAVHQALSRARGSVLLPSMPLTKEFVG